MNRREFDGVLCFGGEDWWYHNRGHNDIRIMREFAKSMPVLFVNSIGLRMPTMGGGGKGLARILRKLQSMRRGLVHVESNFWVMSPFMVPGQFGQVLTGSFLPVQLKLALQRVGIRKPLLWVVPPSVAPFVNRLQHAALVFQRSDRLELYKDTDHELLGGYVKSLMSIADTTVYCNHALMGTEQTKARNALFVDHGVNFELFASKGRGDFQEPEDIKPIEEPRVGFVGGVEPHTFDPDLFVAVAKVLPQVNFVVVGRDALPTGWCPLPNVHFLGAKAMEEVADYMAACDVLIMPWNDSEWIRDCNPIKLKEYLAVGRPIVTTPFNELDHYPGLVNIAKTPEDFAEAIKCALRDGSNPEVRRTRVMNEGWSAKAGEILSALEALGITYGKV